jgi:hypothetical protein
MPTPGEISNAPRRNRIVINLDEPGQAGAGAPAAFGSKRRKRRGLFVKILGFIGLLTVLILVSAVVGGYFWWQSYKKKPAYSLALMVDAVQRNDIQTFDKFVDTDSVANNLFSQVSEKATTQYTTGLPGAIKKQVDSVLPRALPSLKQRIHDEVAGQTKELSARAQGRSVPLVALGISYLASINQMGDAASAEIKLPNRNIDLNMQRNGDTWKVVGIKDDTLAQRILESMARDVPVVAPQVIKDSKKNSKGGSITLPDVRIPGIR